MDAITCSKCSLCLGVEKFSLNKSKKSGYNSECRVCAQAYGKEHYTKNKQYYKDKRARLRPARRGRNQAYMVKHLVEHPCVDCGEKDPVVLEFDHKELASGCHVTSLTDSSLDRIQKEIDKCEVRCANCHRRRTRVQLGWPCRGGGTVDAPDLESGV